MTSKYQRPGGAYAGQAGLGNRTKYQDDATAVPKRAISSAKVDGDFNYLVDALNQVDEASGTRASIAERLDVALNPDGTLKFSTTGALDEWIVQLNPGAIARVDNASFSMAGGNFSAVYVPGRRVRLVVSGVAIFGDVVSASFSGGVTTVGLAEVVDVTGSPAVIAAAPSQVSYGPVTSGVAGNLPRRADSVGIVSGANLFRISGSGGDLVINRNGTEVARVGSGGVSGIADGAVGLPKVDAAVAARLMPSGAVMPFAGSSAPTGWLLCAGQAISRTVYADLFAAIGVAHGAGDGSTTFNVPDLRGRAAFGLDNMGGTAASRVTSSVSGINGVSLGATGGSEALQAHSHTATVTDPGHSHILQGTSGGTGGAYCNQPLTTGSVCTTRSATTGITVTNSTTGSGGSQNMPPVVMLNYIIKV